MDDSRMIDTLVSRILSYNKDADIESVKKAFYLAKDAHKDQLRNSGEEYFIHPYNVALILADMNMDVETIIAGLLHDVIEDTSYTYDQISNMFGQHIADLVDGVTKLKKLNYKTKQEKQAENLRKMVLAMAKDIRVIIVKLADRLHNMRTLEYMTPEKKREKALETIEIYAPLAHRLGISKIKWELEDLSLRYLDSDNYYDLVEKVNKRRNEREALIQTIISTLSKQLDKTSIKHEIKGRPKNFYSIYKKMMVQGKNFDEIYDLSAIRVLVDSVNDCYGVLGIVHSLWKPIPGRFKDYVAMPKPNMYQSLHTTVIDEHGDIFEVQIRTYEMHKTAEYGIAAHWKYKEGTASSSDNFDDKLTWLRQLLEWQTDLKDPTDFMESLKMDFFADEVFAFTPNGDVINLPEDSTPIDFAYRVHTAVGNKCVGAKVNGRIVPLNYKLNNGEIVEIITSSSASPSYDWLNIVKTTQAKNKIKQFFKFRDREANILKGKEILEKEIKKFPIYISESIREPWLEEIAKQKFRFQELDDLFAAIGYGSTSVNAVISKFKEKYNAEYKNELVQKEIEGLKESKKHKKENVSSQGISVKGADNIKVRFAKCCNPVPGDSIIGYVTRGRGVTVHRSDCVCIDYNDDANRFINVEWNIDSTTSYAADLEIRAIDRSGLIADIVAKINDSKITLNSISAKNTKDGIVIIKLSLEIKNIDELEKIREKLKSVANVLDIYRISG